MAPDAAVSCPSGGGPGTGQASSGGGGGSRLSRGDRSDVTGGTVPHGQLVMCVCMYVYFIFQTPITCSKETIIIIII